MYAFTMKPDRANILSLLPGNVQLIITQSFKVIPIAIFQTSNQPISLDT